MLRWAIELVARYNISCGPFYSGKLITFIIKITGGYSAFCLNAAARMSELGTLAPLPQARPTKKRGQIEQ